MANSYTTTFGSKQNIIGISGIIGVGKSTLTKKIGEKLGWNILKEPVEENEYLNNFYENMAQFSFPMQVYLLNHRFKQHQQMVWSDNNTIQDRTKESNLMSELDFKTYVDLFQNMANFLHRPDLIVYLNVEPEIALQRINERSRGCETGITIEYLKSLKEGYEEWLSDVEDRIPVLKLDWNSYQDTDVIILKIKEKIKEKKGIIL